MIERTQARVRILRELFDARAPPRVQLTPVSVPVRKDIDQFFSRYHAELAFIDSLCSLLHHAHNTVVASCRDMICQQR